MTIKKILGAGIFLILIIEIGNAMLQKKLQNKLRCYQYATKQLDKKKIQLDEARSFIQSRSIQNKRISILKTNPEWAKAYVYDLVNRVLKEENLRGTFQVEDSRESGFFPEILKINEIPVILTLGQPDDYFKVLKLVRHFEDEHFYVDSLCVSTGGENFGEGFSLSLKYFYSEE